jgi:hypothetical protein
VEKAERLSDNFIKCSVQLFQVGHSRSYDVKEHHYFNGIDWNAVPADFIP